MSQQIDTLVQPVFCNNPTVPLVVRTVTPRADGTMLVGGAAQGGQVVSEYILLSALPQDLRERVVTAIKAQMQG
jgi:hypothetical protein